MSPKKAERREGKPKKPIQVLRERRGGVPQELTERNRRQTDILKVLRKALEDGPKTPPELAAAVDMPTHEVFWYLMGMRKYGEIVEGEERDDYFEYRLTKEKESTS